MIVRINDKFEVYLSEKDLDFILDEANVDKFVNARTLSDAYLGKSSHLIKLRCSDVSSIELIDEFNNDNNVFRNVKYVLDDLEVLKNLKFETLLNDTGYAEVVKWDDLNVEGWISKLKEVFE